jgi:hypothetical protein
VSLAAGERCTRIAPVGQNSWQQKQRMQALRRILALPPTMVMAEAGQSLAHLPQPVQSPPTAGRERKSRYMPCFRSFLAPRSSSVRANQEAVAPER